MIVYQCHMWLASYCQHGTFKPRWSKRSTCCVKIFLSAWTSVLHNWTSPFHGHKPGGSSSVAAVCCVTHTFAVFFRLECLLFILVLRWLTSDLIRFQLHSCRGGWWESERVGVFLQLLPLFLSFLTSLGNGAEPPSLKHRWPQLGNLRALWSVRHTPGQTGFAFRWRGAEGKHLPVWF